MQFVIRDIPSVSTVEDFVEEGGDDRREVDPGG